MLHELMGSDGKVSPYYASERRDMVALVPESARTILEIGCGSGGTGRLLRERGVDVLVGVELNPDAAELAKAVFDRVIVGNVEALDLSRYRNCFDCILYGDVLEHLVNPWHLLRDHYTLLRDGGVVVASIPNIRHYSILIPLLFQGQWNYQKQGILDQTHLRFFTLDSIKELFSQAHLDILDIHRQRGGGKFVRRLNRILCKALNDFITVHYVVRARKRALEE